MLTSQKLKKVLLMSLVLSGEIQNFSTVYATPRNTIFDYIHSFQNVIQFSRLLQVHMATAHGNLGEHQFGATPHNWPLMGKLLPYWLDEKSNVIVQHIQQ